MRITLLLVLFVFSSLNCFSAEYVNKKLGLKLAIPSGAIALEGNYLQPNQDNQNAITKVFEMKPQEIKQQLNNILFTVGYFSGDISKGADATIIVSACNAIGDNPRQVQEFTSALIKREEKENDYMSFKFTEKAKEVKISNQSFLVSKGILKIKSKDKVTFSMPIYFYISKIQSYIVAFNISGNEKMVPELESSLLNMKLDVKN